MTCTHKTSDVQTYNPEESAVFLKTKEKFGGLSNMASGFPLCVNGTNIRTSEALYQACRFPHMPDIQKEIINEASPMTAKMRSKPYRKHSRSDWDDVRVEIMRWSLQVKLVQNRHKFESLLLETGDKPIVEKSSKDDFWGAKVTEDGMLVGRNKLGCLLMELRENIIHGKVLNRVDVLPIEDFLLFHMPIETVKAVDISNQRSPIDNECQMSLFG